MGLRVTVGTVSKPTLITLGGLSAETKGWNSLCPKVWESFYLCVTPRIGLYTSVTTSVPIR